MNVRLENVGLVEAPVIRSSIRIIVHRTFETHQVYYFYLQINTADVPATAAAVTTGAVSVVFWVKRTLSTLIITFANGTTR